MQFNSVPELTTANYLIPILVAFSIILIFSFVKEPYRKTINALIIASAGATYFNNGLGYFEYPFVILLLFCAYKGLTNYKFIALGWILHTLWDLAHHYTGNPMLSVMPTSSWECAINDAILAVWFFYGAPSLFNIFNKNNRFSVSNE